MSDAALQQLSSPRSGLTGGEIIARMKAWLLAENQAKGTAFVFHMVFSFPEAAQMSENNAHELMRGAELEYPEWELRVAKIPNNQIFVVEGTKK